MVINLVVQGIWYIPTQQNLNRVYETSINKNFKSYRKQTLAYVEVFYLLIIIIIYIN